MVPLLRSVSKQNKRRPGKPEKLRKIDSEIQEIQPAGESTNGHNGGVLAKKEQEELAKVDDLQLATENQGTIGS